MLGSCRYSKDYMDLSALKKELEQKSKRINRKALKTLLKKGNGSYLKFVISAKKSEIKEILEIQKNLNLKNNQIYLMPWGANNADIESNANKVINKAIKYHFNYTDRLHIRIWNNKRKV